MYIKVDTSKKGIGVAMLQEDCTVQNTSRFNILNNLRPISYASKTLSSTESNYSNIECELLGVLFAITHFKYFTYGHTVHVITDHKLLVSLFKKSLVDASPCLTRMLMQLLDYTLNVCYQRGDKMHLSDALSHLSSHNNATGKTIKNLDISIHVIEELTGFDSFSVEKLHHHTSIDSMLQLLIDHINNGFPDLSNQCPDSIKPYFSFRNELSACNGLVLKGHNRVIIPTSLRRQAINLLHNKAHLGLNKTLERARSCMYWLGITDDIQSSISACKLCLTYSTKQQHEPYAVDAQVKPWMLMSLDNFELQGMFYLMLLDVATKFVIVRPVQSLNAEVTIHVLTSIFSEHGLPIGVRCDRGHDFVSDLFQQYCKHLGIQLSYSSACHHSSNPAERAICTVKGLMKCCVSAKQSWRLALLEYLSTPLDAKTPSPSELNGRKFGSMLPNVSNFSTQHSDRLVERHTAQLQHDTKGHSMCELPVGSTVGYRDHIKNQFNVGIVSDRKGRDLMLLLPNPVRILAVIA